MKKLITLFARLLLVGSVGVCPAVFAAAVINKPTVIGVKSDQKITVSLSTI